MTRARDGSGWSLVVSIGDDVTHLGLGETHDEAHAEIERYRATLERYSDVWTSMQLHCALERHLRRSHGITTDPFALRDELDARHGAAHASG